MKWDIAAESDVPYSYIYVIGYKLGIHVNFAICWILGCLCVMGSKLLC